MISAADIRFACAERFAVYLRSETLAVTYGTHAVVVCLHFILFFPRQNYVQSLLVILASYTVNSLSSKSTKV